MAEQNVSPGIGSFNQAVDAKALKDLPSNAFFMEHMLESSKSQKINVSLPIFDQTTEIFCKRNVIIGRKFLSDWRENTHAVLSGHRGLPEAKLFTDLPKLKKGDQFSSRSMERHWRIK